MEDKILGILDSIINNISDDIISKDEREKITINVNKNNSISFTVFKNILLKITFQKVKMFVEIRKLDNINFDSEINLITFELDIFGFERKNLSKKVYKYGLNLDSECLNVYVQDILFNVQDRLEFLNKIKKVYKNKNDIAYSQEAYIPNGTEWKKLE